MSCSGVNPFIVYSCHSSNCHQSCLLSFRFFVCSVLLLICAKMNRFTGSSLPEFSIAKLKTSRLPTRIEVLEAVLFEKKKVSKPILSTIFKTIAVQVADIWDQSIIPKNSVQQIEAKVMELHQSYLNVMKFKSKNNFEQKIQEFKEASKALFDICKCKCPEISHCKCDYSNKVPKKEKEFLIDQRTVRKMTFGSIDHNATANFERKQAANARLNPPKTGNRKVAVKSGDTDQVIHIKPALTPLPMKKVKLINVGTVLNAKNISHRNGATICNAMLKDMGYSIEDDIIDPSRVQRAKEASRKMAVVSHLNMLRSQVDELPIIGLFFDGKKDQTLNIVHNTETDQSHPRIVAENHYAILIEPGHHFYTHITPNGSDAVTAAKCIYDKLISDNIDCNKIHIIGSDGTVFNTGHISGTYRLLNLRRVFFEFLYNIYRCDL